MAKTFCFSVRIESIEWTRRNRRTYVSGHFSLTGFLFRTLCRMHRVEQETTGWLMRDNATAWNLLLEQRRTISLWKWLIRENPSFHRSQQNTHGGKKKQHLLVFAFAVAENQKETKRKPTWKSQVSKNKKKPTVANSAIFYPKSSITPENQVTMYWVKRDNRTTLVVIGLPTLLKQPTKLKKDF